MDRVVLKRTGLSCSVLGLGGGGQSRLGQSAGCDEPHSVAVVRQALELGVNFFDTSEAYGTEGIIGRAVADRKRDELVLCSKKVVRRGDELIRAEDLAAGLDASLRRLDTEYLDIYLVHGVSPGDYPRVRDELVGALDLLRDRGKVRFVGITEAFNSDRNHRTLNEAVADAWPDVIMAGFNILNQSFRDLLPEARRQGIGVLAMFVVRQALHDAEMLRRTVSELIDRGLISGGGVDRDDPLGFVLDDGAAGSLPDAAYRFCRDEPGIDVVLSGTGSVAHLEENVRSICRPPLPGDVRERLVQMFAGVDCVSGQEPPVRLG